MLLLGRGVNVVAVVGDCGGVAVGGVNAVELPAKVTELFQSAAHPTSGQVAIAIDGEKLRRKKVRADGTAKLTAGEYPNGEHSVEVTFLPATGSGMGHGASVQQLHASLDQWSTQATVAVRDLTEGRYRREGMVRISVNGEPTPVVVTAREQRTAVSIAAWLEQGRNVLVAKYVPTETEAYMTTLPTGCSFRWWPARQRAGPGWGAVM